MVNTYAWMNATNNSNKFINTPNKTDTTVIEPFIAGPILTVMNIKLVKARITECPAIIFANKRIIKANGFVKTPNNSTTGINGTGTFNQLGTSGQNISFQYSLFPNKLTAKKVNNAKTNVTAILPVTLAPAGKTGISPIRLFKKIKKKTVSR